MSSSSRPPLLGLLNPSGRHYSSSNSNTYPLEDDDPSRSLLSSSNASFRTADPHQQTRQGDARDGEEDEEEDEEVPPSFLFEQHQPQSVMEDQESTFALGGDRRHPRHPPSSSRLDTSRRSSSSSNTSSNTSSGSSSNISKRSDSTINSPPSCLLLNQQQPRLPSTQGSPQLPFPATSPIPQLPSTQPSSSTAQRQPLPSAPPLDRPPDSASFPSPFPKPPKLHGRRKTNDTTTTSSRRSVGGSSRNKGRSKAGLDAYEKALWDWVNVQDLDSFLQDVYSYYKGKGIYCIVLSRALNLVTIGFVIIFSTFLLRCVDFSLLRTLSGQKTSLEDIIVPRCVAKFSGFTLFAFLAFAIYYIWQIIAFVSSIRGLLTIHRFYTHLLGVPDADVQTISWPTIVHLIGQIRESNPLTSLSSRPALALAEGRTSSASPLKLDAHDVANRILRQENYLIALFNKDVLDLSVPLPFLRDKQVLTRALEWNLRWCLIGYLCEEGGGGARGRGGVRKVFLREKNKKMLVEGLQRRLVFMAIVNATFAPFIVLYLLMYSFFRYFEEYHKNPSSIGGRTYTPFAKWKFREFNELPHLFQTRLDESYPVARQYIDQFPKERVAIFMRFISFIAGSFAAVLLLASVLDPDLVIHFEITPNRSILFYITLFGGILAVSRGMTPDDNHVFDPEMLMRAVVDHTHYLPEGWKGKLHSQQVHDEFGQLFAMKIQVFVTELLSVVLTPFVLWLSLPKCAPAIIDFFREFSVHVDGVGYVCSFAVFDFKRHGNQKFGAPTDVKEERFMSKEGKMEKSFVNFKASNPTWNPTDPSSSIFLSRLTDINASFHPPSSRSPFAPRPPSALSRSIFATPAARGGRLNPSISSFESGEGHGLSASMYGSTADLTRRTPARSGLGDGLATGGVVDRKGKGRSRSLTRTAARGAGGGREEGPGGVLGMQIDEERALEGRSGDGGVEEEDEGEDTEWDDFERKGGRKGGKEAERETNRHPDDDEEALPEGDILSLLSNVYRVKMGK